MSDDVNHAADPEVEQYIQQLATNYGQQMGSFPEPPDKDNMLKFLRDVVSEQDHRKQTKTANFREEETGRTKVPVLAYFQVGGYADSEGYDMVGEYLRAKAANIAAVSMGRKFKLMETTFTVRRETKNFGTPRTTTKRGFLGAETTVKEGYE